MAAMASAADSGVEWISLAEAQQTYVCSSYTIPFPKWDVSICPSSP